MQESNTLTSIASQLGTLSGTLSQFISNCGKRFEAIEKTHREHKTMFEEFREQNTKMLSDLDRRLQKIESKISTNEDIEKLKKENQLALEKKTFKSVIKRNWWWITPIVVAMLFLAKEFIFYTIQIDPNDKNHPLVRITHK